MYKALVCCRAGMGSSMLLKIKADQVIRDNGFPIFTEHGNLDNLTSFNGDLVITMDDLYPELLGKVPYVIGIHSVLDKADMKQKIEQFLKWEQEQRH